MLSKHVQFIFCCVDTKLPTSCGVCAHERLETQQMQMHQATLTERHQPAHIGLAGVRRGEAGRQTSNPSTEALLPCHGAEFKALIRVNMSCLTVCRPHARAPLS